MPFCALGHVDHHTAPNSPCGAAIGSLPWIAAHLADTTPRIGQSACAATCLCFSVNITRPRGGRASLVNCCSTRTVCQLCTPKGCPAPFMPGLKSMADTILRVPWMSNTQCAAVSTCFSPISVPVHSSALRRRLAVSRGRRERPYFPQCCSHSHALQSSARRAWAAPCPCRTRAGAWPTMSASVPGCLLQLRVATTMALLDAGRQLWLWRRAAPRARAAMGAHVLVLPIWPSSWPTAEYGNTLASDTCGRARRVTAAARTHSGVQTLKRKCTSAPRSRSGQEPRFLAVADTAVFAHAQTRRCGTRVRPCRAGSTPACACRSRSSRRS